MKKVDFLKEVESQEIVEVVLYILNATGALDYYRIFKVLYFAERSYLAEWGRKFTADTYYALPAGPVPSRLYDAIKLNENEPILQNKLFGDRAVSFDDGVTCVLVPLRPADMNWIAPAAIGALDNAIKKYSNATFSELKAISHDTAYDSTTPNAPIDNIDIARAGGASEGMIEYAREMTAIEEALM